MALFNPREQVWAEHFVFRSALIVGLTPVGRATVYVLDMNTKEQVKIREDTRQTADLE